MRPITSALLFFLTLTLAFSSVAFAENPVAFTIEVPALERISTDKTPIFEGTVTEANTAIMSGILSVGVNMTLEEYYSNKKQLPNAAFWADATTIGIGLFVEAYDGAMKPFDQAVPYMDNRFTQANVVAIVSSVAINRLLNNILK